MVPRFETGQAEACGIGSRIRPKPKSPALACGENGAPAKLSCSKRTCHLHTIPAKGKAHRQECLCHVNFETRATGLLAQGFGLLLWSHLRSTAKAWCGGIIRAGAGGERKTTWLGRMLLDSRAYPEMSEIRI